MSTSGSRHENKFSATTSRYLLPTFRRPCYMDIIKMSKNDEFIDPSNIFYQWTLENDLSLYKEINDALLSDNYDVLKKHMIYINNLRNAIKQNNFEEPIKVYRNLILDSSYVLKEYQENQVFLWPTFSSTSRNKAIASRFGNYTFEIDAAPKDFTYQADISQFSRYPHEEEVLFYPYSGFRVKRILTDARIIHLECIDTLAIELYSKELIPNKIKLMDKNRGMYVYLYKDRADLHWSTICQPDILYGIAQNQYGYWDSHDRFHHKNGYFLKGQNSSVWEEYKNSRYFASFQKV